MNNERRRTPRYPFTGSIEMQQESSEDKRTAKVSELSLNGCFVQMREPYPVGTSLSVRVFTDSEFFEGRASVVYVNSAQGMGLRFRETKPFFLSVLRRWILSAMMTRRIDKN
jgi:hypothetical protein